MQITTKFLNNSQSKLRDCLQMWLTVTVNLFIGKKCTERININLWQASIETFMNSNNPTCILLLFLLTSIILSASSPTDTSQTPKKIFWKTLSALFCDFCLVHPSLTFILWHRAAAANLRTASKEGFLWSLEFYPISHRNCRILLCGFFRDTPRRTGSNLSIPRETCVSVMTLLRA